ncbi:hypothetical protein GCM10010869_16530 [Mesorhizobium tianshanense]|uniref:Uncharacterized protein n=1 Tax=Mesorhizobium tianshanense TaxID=39844 RepID=A0A562NVZ1_9HYPH|nr:hypothetical protein [Mesorhizobium tianshanense]TWI36397.1 hypothetical protein IQ26_02910 [Mesorhizobium tianshanense]GLS36064.1 hypothetical protein GCM10010869_16530 [Mesorhizobium tianshanense]
MEEAIAWLLSGQRKRRRSMARQLQEQFGLTMTDALKAIRIARMRDSLAVRKSQP